MELTYPGHNISVQCHQPSITILTLKVVTLFDIVDCLYFTQFSNKEGFYSSVRKQVRLLQAEESLFRVPPNESERILIHEKFLKTVDQK